MMLLVLNNWAQEFFQAEIFPIHQHFLFTTAHIYFFDLLIGKFEYKNRATLKNNFVNQVQKKKLY